MEGTCYKSRGARDWWGGHGGVEAVVEVMKLWPHDVDILGYACQAIRAIMWQKHQDNITKLMDQGAPGLIRDAYHNTGCPSLLTKANHVLPQLGQARLCTPGQESKREAKRARREFREESERQQRQAILNDTDNTPAPGKFFYEQLREWYPNNRPETEVGHYYIRGVVVKKVEGKARDGSDLWEVKYPSWVFLSAVVSNGSFPLPCCEAADPKFMSTYHMSTLELEGYYWGTLPPHLHLVDSPEMRDGIEREVWPTVFERREERTEECSAHGKQRGASSSAVN